ncbi:MAG: hypothetical protein U1B78_07565 [Dehalococcoidia bacterium]|nr:hypothetical protein [Dehalococcoidia bacterium]
MSSLATIRAAVRQDLHDEDAAVYRWLDAVLDRHVKRALREYSLVSPLEQKSTLTTAANSRDVSISTLTPRLRIVAAEYPTGEYPPEYTPFLVWGDTLTLDLEAAPSGTPNVNVLWHKVHDINGSVTFPATHDDIVATGGAAFAALDWASFASNRVNVGGDAVWGRYMEFGQERLKQFQEQLRGLPAANRLQPGRFYTPAVERLRSQTTDPGPV